MAARGESLSSFKERGLRCSVGEVSRETTE
jgi:hypothetical protein